MALAGSLQKVAKKVIAKFGGAVTFRFLAPSAYDAETGDVTATVTTANIKGVLDDVRSSETNELIRSTDKKLTVAALDLDSVPSTDDQVEISSVRYQIVQISTIDQAGTAIVYDLFLRA